MRELGTLLSLVNLALGMRGKKHKRAARFLTGGSHPFLNASTLLGAAGLAAGLFETYRARRGSSDAPPPVRPGTTEQRASGPAPAQTAAPDPRLQRLVRLTVSAARARLGQATLALGRAERAVRAGGVEELMRAELDRPRPLSEIVAGVEDPAQRRDLYTLAYCVVRADEGVSGSERIYLAQLAALLGFDAAAVAALERDADARIDSPVRN
jgi:uncharacterized membrane protein YebE (DUF533 family)